MLILLDRDGVEVATLPYEEPPDDILVDGVLYVREDRDGDDYIYREVES